GVIRLLSKMSSGRAMLKDTLRAEIMKALGLKRAEDVTEWIRALTRADAIRLGVEVQCTVCAQRSWYALDQLRYQLLCPKCLGDFEPPAHSPSDMKWAYRAHGPFSLPDHAFGAYSVLLARRLFTDLLHVQQTTMLSFSASRGDQEL